MMSLLEKYTTTQNKSSTKSIDLSHKPKQSQICSLNSNSFDAKYAHNIRHLSLSGNSITKLEQSPFEPLVNLKSLNLDSNNLDTLESTAFDGLVNLENLDISNNQLDSLENETVFEKLKRLKRLELSGNRIKLLCRGVTNASINGNWASSSLIRLDLSRNLIESIEANVFDGLTNLKVLNLCYNELKKIEPKCFNALKRLVHLELGNNKIVDIQRQSFIGLSNLKWLCLDNNQLCFISSIL